MTRTLFGRAALAPLALLAAPLLGAALAPLPAMAQAQETTDNRLKRIEGEVRALQRKVFPDGAGKTFAPEITPGAASTAAPVGTPAAGPLTDLLTRMDAVETQIQRLTAQSEESQNRMGKLEDRLARLEAAGAAEAAASTAASTASAASTAPVSTAPATTRPAPSTETKPATRPASAAASTATPSAERLAAVRAVVKPKTTDAGEDEYIYGYNLWEAKFYPEAQQQLQKVVTQYPRHKRISFARNLLGRAWLDDDKPGTAAQFFLQNYLADKKGARAPDSLLYLGVAMTRIKDTKRACGAFDEMRATYAPEIAGRLKSQFEAATRAVKCD